MDDAPDSDIESDTHKELLGTFEELPDNDRNPILLAEINIKYQDVIICSFKQPKKRNHHLHDE